MVLGCRNGLSIGVDWTLCYHGAPASHLSDSKPLWLPPGAKAPSTDNPAYWEDRSVSMAWIMIAPRAARRPAATPATWPSQELSALTETHPIAVSPRERQMVQKLAELKRSSGSHSPSLSSMQEALPDIRVEIDACYLSNPLATDLFWKYFNRDVFDDQRLFKRMLEAYPSQNRVIAERLASTVGVDASRIFIANGATDAIQAILHNYSLQVHVVIPTFSPYYEFASSPRSVTTFRTREEDDFRLDPEHYVDSVIESAADTAVLISPNNPDGYYIPEDELRWILSQLSGLSSVVVDESFVHFARDRGSDTLPTLVGITEMFPNVSVIKSMSKDFGIAGIRAGYAIMNPQRVDELLQNGYLWNVNGIAEYFFSLFGRQQFLDEYREVLRKYKGYIGRFTSRTAEADFMRGYPTSANFQLMQTPDGMTSELATALLLVKHGVYVRDAADKIGLKGEYIRVAIRTDEENSRVFNALEDVLG